MEETNPNQDDQSFEPVKEETLQALEDVIFDCPHARRLQPQRLSRQNPHRLLGPFLYLELENKDSNGSDISIFIDGEFIEWFDEEVAAHVIDLLTNCAPEGWQNTRYMIIRNDEGEMLATKQDSLVQQTDEDVLRFNRALHGALESDEDSMVELYAEALKQKEETIEQARALEVEHELGLTQVSEQEAQQLINLIQTGTKPES